MAPDIPLRTVSRPAIWKPKEKPSVSTFGDASITTADYDQVQSVGGFPNLATNGMRRRVAGSGRVSSGKQDNANYDRAPAMSSFSRMMPITNNFDRQALMVDNTRRIIMPTNAPAI